MDEHPATGRPLLTSGRWLDPSRPDGVVLESSLARALLAGPGDVLTLTGDTATLTVLGVADSAEPGYRKGERPGLVWVPPTALPHSVSDDGQVIGLRLTDPADTDYVVQRAVTLLGAGAVSEVSSWQQARAEAQGDDRLLGQVLGLFGLGALVAAGLAVHGAIGTRVRGHLRDISILKAIGFTPSQVVRVFLLQHLAYALLGAGAAATLMQALGPRMPGRLGDAVGVWQGLPGHTVALVAVPVAVVLFIGATTGLAAWRAGRVPPVPVPRTAAPAAWASVRDGTPGSRPAGAARAGPRLAQGLHAPTAHPGHDRPPRPAADADRDGDERMDDHRPLPQPAGAGGPGRRAHRARRRQPERLGDAGPPGAQSRGHRSLSGAGGGGPRTGPDGHDRAARPRHRRGSLPLHAR